MQCLECTTDAISVAENRDGEHWQCPKCRALWGWEPVKAPKPPWMGDRMTYHHSGEEVRALEKFFSSRTPTDE